MIYINQFLLSIFNQFKKFYLNSNIYNKKISKVDDKELIYKPSPHLLSSLIKYQKKKFKIEDFSLNEIWNDTTLSSKEQKNFNNFYWFFSLDLKSSKFTTQSLISNWIKNNERYNDKSWDFDLTAKRIIAWLSCYNLTCEGGDQDYRKKFNRIIQKQSNHLINEINNSEQIDDKLIGCASIILVGLCYREEKNYLSFGSSLLKKISKMALDNYGLPKSRNFGQLIFYLKYYILIREWFKEAQIDIPEQIDETIYYLGQGYAFLWQNIKSDILMNGNNISNNSEFDQYLKRFGYNFKNENKEFGGYAILYNKKISIVMDIASPPSSKFSSKYQSGALSFEINSNGKKLISNCGYYNKDLKIKELSKSTAVHNTLIIDDSSSCTYKKRGRNSYIINDNLKVLKKNIIFEKNYWKITSSHDGYQKKYNSIHDREIEFFPEKYKFIGTDKILNKKNNLNIKFDIRFHFEPSVKLMKTQDKETILIELEDEGWKFTCDNYNIDIDGGLYFGNKNSYTQNQNIFISGITNKQDENIIWQLSKI